jgi:hypothetical protein
MLRDDLGFLSLPHFSLTLPSCDIERICMLTMGRGVQTVEENISSGMVKDGPQTGCYSRTKMNTRNENVNSYLYKRGKVVPVIN